MKGRATRIAFRQLLELASKDVVHSQCLRNVPGNIAVTGPAGVEVYLLQQDQIPINAGENVNNFCELLTAIDVPGGDADHIQLRGSRLSHGKRPLLEVAYR